MNLRVSDVRDGIGLARKCGYRANAFATELGYSLRQLERLFVREHLESPTAWMREVRAWEAARLLLQRFPPKQVAMELGFRGLSHFYRHFKSRHGVAPVEFVLAHDRIAGVSPPDPRRNPGPCGRLRLPPHVTPTEALNRLNTMIIEAFRVNPIPPHAVQRRAKVSREVKQCRVEAIPIG